MSEQTTTIGVPEGNAYVFNWKLNPDDFKTTIFEKKKMNEMTDIKKVYGFIKNQMGINYEGVKRYENLPYKTELDQMIKYKDSYNKKQKKFIVSFHLPKHKWGRTIPAYYTSLSVYHRPTRHSLCDGIYEDIDMVNAQPTIILEICRHHNIDLPALKLYVDNPKHFREAIMRHHKVNKDIAKNLPITLMFGGSYDGWLREHNITYNDNNKIQEIIDIETQIKTIIEIVYSNNKDTIEKAVLKQDPNKWKTIDEKKRGVMALWSQSVERLLQEATIAYLVDEKHFKLEDIVPCQDGFMILKELWYDGILVDIENVLRTKFNIHLNYIRKPFDEAIEIPIYDEEKSVNEWEDLLSAKKLADRFKEEWGNYIVIEEGLLFIYRDNRWWNETDDKKKYKLTLYISEDLYELLEAELQGAIELDEKELIKLMKLLRQMTSKGGAFNDIVRQILPMVKQVKDTFNKKEYLLGFENGVVDLRTSEFRPYNYDDYMTISTKYDYVEVEYGREDFNVDTKEWEVDYLKKDENGNYEYDITEEQIALWTENRKLFDELYEIINTIQPNKEQRTLYLQILASGLDGRPYQKLFLFNGQGGNGKGLTGALMGKTLGDYYYQAPNGILKDAEKSNTPSPDMYNCMGKRYINFKEVGGGVRVAMLRNLTGGGDFTGRLLHSNPIQFKMTATFAMEFNNAPDLDGKPQASDYRRLTHIDFPVNFTDDENKIGKEIGGIHYKKANTYYETDEFITKMRPIFLDLLLNVYKTCYTEGKGIIFTIPKSVRERTEKFIEDQNLFQKVFNNQYKKTGNDADTVPLKDVWNSFQESEDYRKLRTTREKNEYGRKPFGEWAENMFKVKSGKGNVKIIQGVVRRNDDEDIDIDIDIDTENIEIVEEK